MFNLIPDSVKEKILKDYQRRRGVVWLFMTAVLSIVVLIFLLPTYVHVFFEVKNVSASVEIVKSSLQLKEADEVVGTIKKTNEQLRTLFSASSSFKTSEIVERALKAKNSFIHITDIEYIETKIGSSTLQLRGIADRRESLREFVTTLESIESFEKVELPVSNFAKDRDIDFSVTIRLLR